MNGQGETHGRHRGRIPASAESNIARESEGKLVCDHEGAASAHCGAVTVASSDEICAAKLFVTAPVVVDQ